MRMLVFFQLDGTTWKENIENYRISAFFQNPAPVCHQNLVCAAYLGWEHVKNRRCAEAQKSSQFSIFNKFKKNGN